MPKPPAKPHARIYRTIWRDDDFVVLSSGAQRLYMVILSLPTLSACGVNALQARWWSTLASDTDRPGIEAAIAELVEARYLVVDEDTEEVLVRSFIKRDEILKSPNMVVAVWKAFEKVVSKVIRHAIVDALPEDFLEGFPEGFQEGFHDAIEKGMSYSYSYSYSYSRLPSPTPAPTPDSSSSSRPARKKSPKPKAPKTLAPAAPAETDEGKVLSPQQAMFQAICDVFDIDWRALDPNEALKPSTHGTGELGKAASDIIKFGGKPDDVAAKYADYCRKFPDVALTPLALAKHWLTLGAKAPAGTTARKPFGK